MEINEISLTDREQMADSRETDDIDLEKEVQENVDYFNILENKDFNFEKCGGNSESKYDYDELVAANDLLQEAMAYYDKQISDSYENREAQVLTEMLCDMDAEREKFKTRIKNYIFQMLCEKTYL
jgi:hypothetical protein